ncbi:TVP38/TMEM64 family protein [Aerophototrophica crusticola]|uniref:TVP38/TMEM64 family membrane protein n=1 Tax=Aerophototrophica crusticola TaxID=1709002 RepID=A0A858R3B7_9PROT|nr:TVP38/TMEM64 family protein [Rhodospirillaceae bacterium B3]
MAAPATPAWKRLLPLAVLAAGIGAVFALDLDRYLSFSALAENRQALAGWVDANPLLAPAGFVLAYALAVALSIPGAIFLTLAGGLLFGVVAGTLYVVAGATLGATLLFLAARTALGDLLRAKAGPWLAKLEDGFRQDALSYLLFLRLVPAFPFWLVNLVPAFLGVRLSTFVIGTFLGIIPGTLVYVSVGNGLGAVLDQGGTPDLGIIFTPSVLLPLLGLAALSLVPILLKRFKRPTEAARG